MGSIQARAFGAGFFVLYNLSGGPISGTCSRLTKVLNAVYPAVTYVMPRGFLFGQNKEVTHESSEDCKKDVQDC